VGTVVLELNSEYPCPGAVCPVIKIFNYKNIPNKGLGEYLDLKDMVKHDYRNILT
jgi:hypothetical protein